MPLKRDEFFQDPNAVKKQIDRFGDFQDRSQDIQVALRVDENVSPGMFRPDPLVSGGYIANSLTLRAVRPDIFVAGQDLEELAVPVPCGRCSRPLDRQFWRLCPYCGSQLLTL